MLMSSNGTRTSTSPELSVEHQPGLSKRIGNPGQVFGSRGLTPLGISTTPQEPFPHFSLGCSTTQ